MIHDKNHAAKHHVTLQNSNTLHFHHRRYHILYPSCSWWKRLLHITSSLSPSNNNQLGRKIIKIISKQKRNVSCVFSPPHKRFSFMLFYTAAYAATENSHSLTRDEKQKKEKSLFGSKGKKYAQTFESRIGFIDKKDW